MQARTIIAAAVAAVLVSASVRAEEDHRPRWTKQAAFTSYSDVSRLSRNQCTLVVTDCETCRYEPDGTATCSTPGIACTASQWTCMRFALPAPDDGTAQTAR